jgi:hypothetical protein
MINALLAKLDKVRRAGPGRWLACCPAHDDRHPSLSIRQTDDDVVLVHCFAGCDIHSILSAINLEPQDLFPNRGRRHPADPLRRPFPAADILQAIAFEALLIATAGVELLSGQPFSDADRERMMLAVERIRAAVAAGGLNHG